MIGLFLAVLVFAGLALTWAVYADRIAALLAGSGKRRFTVESAAKADETIRELTVKLRAAMDRPCANCGHVQTWPTTAELATSDRTDPAPTSTIPAAVDTGWTPAKEPAQPKPHLLTELVAPDPEATQSLGVAALRAAAAMDAGETQVMPVAEVRNAVAAAPAPPLRDQLPPVTWGRTKDPETAQIEAALSIPAPTPGAGASEISMAAGLAAVTKIQAVMSEAS